MRIAAASSIATTISLSPDGRRIAYIASATGNSQLYVQLLSELRPHVLAGTTGARYPEFSPDGKWIAFESGAVLMKISVDGGLPVILCNTGGGEGIAGMTWESDHSIIDSRFVLADRGILWRISANGGEP